MKSLIDRVFVISPGERRKVVLAFLYAFSVFGACVVGRTAANALFLARLGADWLPIVYILSAVSVGIVAALLLRFTGGHTSKQVMLVTLVLLSITSVILCQLVQKFDHAAVLLVAIYLLAEIRGCLATIQYGILVNDLFAGGDDHHHATGLLGSAATLAGIVFGVLVAFEVYQVGTVHLLYIVAAMEMLAIIPIVLLPPIETTNRDDGEEDAEAGTKLATIGVDCCAPVPNGRGVRSSARSPNVRRIAILVAVTVVVATLIEFQWKSAVAISFATKEDQMTSFFGLFQAVVNLATGTIQVLVAGRILSRLGPTRSLLVFPTALLAGTLAVLLSSFDRVALSAISFAKGCDVFRRSINDPATLLLYSPFSNGLRRQAITFVSGIVKPAAEAVAAVLILSTADVMHSRSISFLALPLICVWLVMVLRHRTEEAIQISS